MLNTSRNCSSLGGTPRKRGAIANGGDRFIPTRSTTNFELEYYKFQQKSENEDEPEYSSLHKKKMQRLIGETFFSRDITNIRVLSYKKQAPVQPKSYESPTRLESPPRHISVQPERVLVAPIRDNYYLNLVDWQASGKLALAIDNCVYLWNAKTADTEQLLKLGGTDYVCSVSWIREGPFLAVGTSCGSTELWDCAKKKKVWVTSGQNGRIGALSWNSNILTSGCRDGVIVHHDIRQDKQFSTQIHAHFREICGLKWSLNGKYLASGSDDHILKIWPASTAQKHENSQPLFSFDQHQAAVRALAWCPWQSHILASGGGACDKSIKFWNMNTGLLSKSVDTQSQVCSLLWSNEYKEIVSGHGYGRYNLIIWKYPTMKKVVQFKAHGSYGMCRVLNLAMSPDETTVSSVGSDEVLKMWKFFPTKKIKCRERRSVLLHHSIR